MWQTDFTHYRLICPDGRPGADVEILTFLDDHSRYALSITCHQPVTGPAVVAAFRQTVADQGIPASVLSTTAWSSPPASPAAQPDGTPSTASPPNSATSTSSKTLPAEPPHHLRQGRTVPTNPEKWLKAQPRQPTTIAELQALCDTFRGYHNNSRPHRSLNRRTPLAAYQARPKATPAVSTQAEPHARVRHDVIDSHGKLTLRHKGRLHHIGIGRTHARTPILMLINDLDIRIIHATTGEIIRELILNPDIDYQPRGVRKGTVG